MVLYNKNIFLMPLTDMVISRLWYTEMDIEPMSVENECPRDMVG